MSGIYSRAVLHFCNIRLNISPISRVPGNPAHDGEPFASACRRQASIRWQGSFKPDKSRGCQDARPIEVRTRVDLASRRDISVSGNEAQGITLPQGRDESHQPPVLSLGKAVMFVADQFDAD